MKNLVAFILLAVVVLGCNTEMKNENAALKAELVALAEENAMLAAGDIVLEMKVEQYQSMLIEIDQNIAAIDKKHGEVKALTANNAEEVEEDILMHMEHVHGNLTNSKHKIAHLQKNINELYKDETIDVETIWVLENELDEAAYAILERDEVIDALNEEVVAEGIDMAVLAEAYEEQAVISEVLYGVLNTAYVVMGTKKDLEEYGIIEKEGGFIGLGKVKSLQANANDAWFLPIPIDATDGFDIGFKKAEVLTTHPESSYEFAGEKIVESIVILDKAAFWDKSDFLVIQIKE